MSLTITASNLPLTLAPARQAPPPAEEAPPRDELTVGEAASGLAGAVTGAAIRSAGCTGATLLRLPGAVAQTYKTLWNTEQLGPVMKCTVGAMVPLVALATPALVALTAAGYGMVQGFEEGSKGGLQRVAQQSADDVRTVFTDGNRAVIESLKQFETEPLKPGQEPYEIKVTEGAKGLVGGAIGLVVDGAGMGLMGLAKTPKALYKIYRALDKSDLGPVKKTAVGLMIPPLVCLAAPVGLVAGAVYGMVVCSKEAYTNGIGSAARKSVENLQDAHRWSHELLENLDK